MKKHLRALALGLTLAVCIGSSTAAPAEAPAAQPADKTPKQITELTGSAASARTSWAFAAQHGSAYRFAACPTRTPADESGAQPAEGAVAVLRLYTTYHPKDNALVNIDGHVFLGISNVSDAGLEVGGLTLAPGTGITVGTRGNRPEHAGLWYDLESYYCYFLPYFYPNLRCIQVSLNAEQLACVNAALAQADKWSALNNCVSFVTAVWNAVCSDRLDPVLPTPEKLTEAMEQYEGKVTVDPDVPYDYIVYYGYPATPSRDYT